MAWARPRVSPSTFARSASAFSANARLCARWAGTGQSVPAENLAYVESTRHRYRASLEQYQRALVEREKITGSQHPEIASLLGGIAENHLFLNELRAGDFDAGARESDSSRGRWRGHRVGR